MLTIIYPPTIDYNFLYQRPQQLMKAFAELGHESIFINPANIYGQPVPEMRPFEHLPNFRVVRHDCFNNNYIKQGTKTVLWISYGHNMFMIDQIKPDVVVYDSIDKASDEFQHWAQYIKPLEAKSDIVFASAKVMFDDHSTRHPNVHMLPNAADYDHFKVARNRIGDRPEEFPDADVIVGYYGAMATWLDHEVVKVIADKYKVVMIGANFAYNHLVDHPNVTILPAKRYEELPRYLSWFDVTIIPFKLTDMITGCDPIKFYEYISAGKPVLVTEMVEMKKYADVVYFMNKDNAPEMVEKALAENSEDKIKARIEVAKRNSWLARAEYAINQINKLVGE